MPMKLPKPCCQPGCPALTHERFCAEHKKLKQKQQDQQRGTAYQRGYNKRWQEYRKWFIRRNPFCKECEAENMLTPTYAVDHVVAHKGDYALFWDTSNHQPLCESHHNRKTVREDGGFGRGAN